EAARRSPASPPPRRPIPLALRRRPPNRPGRSPRTWTRTSPPGPEGPLREFRLPPPARSPPPARGGTRRASPWPRQPPGAVQEAPDPFREGGREAVLGVPEPIGQPQPLGLTGPSVQAPRLLLVEEVVVPAVDEEQRHRSDLAHYLLGRFGPEPLVGEPDADEPPELPSPGRAGEPGHPPDRVGAVTVPPGGGRHGDHRVHASLQRGVADHGDPAHGGTEGGHALVALGTGPGHHGGHVLRFPRSEGGEPTARAVP